MYVIQSVQEKKKKNWKKLWKEGEGIKCLELFFHRPMASQKMFPCVVSEHTESKEGKHSLLQTTCNRFFLKPNKSTLCFRSCDTFCALCYSQHILFHPPTFQHCLTRTHKHCTHIHTTHAHSEFPFPVRKITCTDRMACFDATCSGRKTGKGVQGCPTWNTRRVRGNPELMAALQFLKTLSKVSLVHFFFCFSTAIMRSTFACAKMFQRGSTTVCSVTTQITS